MKTDLLKIEVLSQENSLDKIANIVPCWIHLNSKLDLGLTYINERMENDMQKNMEGIKNYGPEYIKGLVHPETTERVIPFLIDLIKSDDHEKVLSYYQLIKLPNKEYEWFLSTTKIHNKDSLITMTVPLSIVQDFKKEIRNIWFYNGIIGNNAQ